MADHSPTDRPPLWEVMRRAESSYCSDLISSDARMIRAVRDWLVPEDWARPSDPADRVRWRRDLELRAVLTAEIDRAERGEGSNA